MIKKLTDLSGISGALPLMSVIQTDLIFADREAEGVFCQFINGEKTLVLSLRGETATLCRLSANVDVEELSLFLRFRNVSNILTDFFFEGFYLEERVVLKAEPQCESSEDYKILSPSSCTIDYKSVFGLLSHNGDFGAWYPQFSRKINNSYACGVYLVAGAEPVSCAVAPFVCGGVGIVAGVFTSQAQRGRGFATGCIKALLSELGGKGIKQAYLWCV
jgi:hypothetical protein